MSKFTKGPWNVEKPSNGIIWIESDCSGSLGVCDLYHKDRRGGLVNKENAEANAHLIAAAPCMFEALNKVLYEVKRTLSDELRDEIEFALSKAEGK